jgi:hypothetical protein
VFIAVSLIVIPAAWWADLYGEIHGWWINGDSDF